MYEHQRILGTLVYKFFVYFPIALLLTYIFYQDFSKDIILTITNVGVGLLIHYLFDLTWAWHTSGVDNYRTKIVIITWVCFLIICFTATGIYSHTKNQPPVSEDDHTNDT